MKGSVIAITVALILIIEKQVSPMVAQNKHHRIVRNPQRGGGGWIGGGIGVGGGTWAGTDAGAGAGAIPGMPSGNNTSSYGFGFGYIPGMGGERIGYPGEEFARYWEKFANFGKFGRR